MGEILKTLVATPASSILLLAGICFLFIAAAGNIAGKIQPGKTGRFVAGVVGTFLLVLSVATGNSEQIPSGTYQGTCHNSYVNDTILFSTCLNRDKQFNPVELPGFKSCQGDISNNNGKLNCKK